MKEWFRPKKTVEEEEYQKDKQKEKDMWSCNKGGHKERSLANQPNHQKWWKKQKTLTTSE